MNTDTGELRRLAAFRGIGMSEKIQSAAKAGFTPVPEEHEEEANEILGEKDAAFADMTADTPLVDWAKRQHRKKTKRTKMVKASRRRNR